MKVVLLCCSCAAARKFGDEQPDARLVQAQVDFDEAIRLKEANEYSAALQKAGHALVLREASPEGTAQDVASCLNLMGDLYRRQTDFSHAEPLYQRSLAIWEATVGKNHATVAQSLNSLAVLYMEQGLYEKAEPLYRRSLAIREAALGKDHPDIAQSLNNLANLYVQQGFYEKAEPLYQRSLTIWEAALGKDHPNVALSFNNLANLYTSQGLYKKAEPLYQRAISMKEAALGKDHADVAQSLNNLANVYMKQGLYEKAEPLYQRALAILEAARGKNHTDVAQSLNNLALLHVKQGLYEKAEPLYQRALAILEAARGKNHLGVAQFLNNLANLYFEKGLYVKAEQVYQRALPILEAALGKNHPDVAAVLSGIANVYAKQGLYEKAELFYQRALPILEATLGASHPEVSLLLNDLAGLYFDKGLYERAEPLYQRALSIQEATLGGNHPQVAESLSGLASLYTIQGLYERAEPLYQRALSLQEATLGGSHPGAADSLDNLASLYMKQGLYEKAEPLYQRSLSIREAAFGKTHPDVAISLHNLASLYLDQERYEEAEPLYQRALSLQEAVLGKNHPVFAQSLSNLASLYVREGLYEKAEPLYQRALAILEATLGDNHPEVAFSLDNLAQLRLIQHRLSDALAVYTRAFSISERRLRQEALDFSESRLAGFLRYLRTEEQALYTLLYTSPGDARVQRLALSAVLLLKGRSVEELANISRPLYHGLGPEDRAAFERLRGLRTQLATLSLATLSLEGADSQTAEGHSRRLQKLADEGDALEAELARRSAPLRGIMELPPPAEIVDRVAASLPRDSALVELIAYQDLTPAPGPGRPGPLQSPTPLRYLALVLRPDASTGAVDLGPAAPIDLAVTRLRDALANRDASFLGLAQELYQLAFKPLRPLLGATHRLLLSCDGQLGLVPFAALHDGHDFLLDSFDFTYLTSGREVLPRPREFVPARSVVVLADPDFTARPLAEEAPSPKASRSDTLERFFSTSRSEFTRGTWVPLPGTRREAEGIQRLLPQAQLFLGPEATKQRLLGLSTPSILHLATHGFFLADVPTASPKGLRAVGHFGELSSPSRPLLQDPLLRSGLVLTGARASSSDAGPPFPSSDEASLVTALELTGLDLWGTQLVVLSACDTGRGEVHLGQGVYGLRRALVVAGAETLVMSLWQVKDDSTQMLMDLYYHHLLAGQGRASALSEAMRELRRSRPHPHDWAPFIALGSDAPLRSIAPSSLAPRACY